MLASDEDALICDMAETYHILDIWALPVELLATLASGLRENARIWFKMNGLREIPTEIVLPQLADTITLIMYALAGGSSKGIEKPELFMEAMRGQTAKKKESKGFDTGEDFMAYRKRILEGIKGNG